MARIIKQVSFQFKGKPYRAVESSNGWCCSFTLDKMPKLMFRVIRDTVVNRGGPMKTRAFINATRKAHLMDSSPIRSELDHLAKLLKQVESGGVDWAIANVIALEG